MRVPLPAGEEPAQADTRRQLAGRSLFPSTGSTRYTYGSVTTVTCDQGRNVVNLPRRVLATSAALVVLAAAAATYATPAAAALIPSNPPVNPAVLAAHNVASIVAARPAYLFASAA